ncbi:MAG: ABC transporter ATP-binding protein [Spirochaetaceae bacterium]|jgi:ABC-2 type transport system ATP-binding protein|nr:ABC transporter ATP-binding protein [Spirochaetaceae bacterium]
MGLTLRAGLGKMREEAIVIEAAHLVRRYGPYTAVDRVSFTIKTGEIVGFLGPNGAGKSTTMNMLTGYLSSTSGTVAVDGLDILEHPLEAKKKIGYLPEHPPLYPEMTVQDYLRFVSEIKKVKSEIRRNHVRAVMETAGLESAAKRLIKNLSKGYRQRVGLAQALIGDPETLILDEPTAGLDPQQIREIRELIARLGKDRTVILSSHILPEVSAVCPRVLIIHRGKIVADDAPETLSKRLSGGNRILLRLEGYPAELEKKLKTPEFVKSVVLQESPEPGTADVIAEAQDGEDIRRELFRFLAKEDIPVLTMRSMDMSLEEIFLNLTTQEEEEKEEKEKQ